MIYVKDGVLPPLIRILCAVANVAEIFGPDATITAGTNGTHKEQSKHYDYAALDVRSKNMNNAEKVRFLEAVKRRLGAGYDCLLEGAGTPNEHFHIEYDPKE